MVTKRERSGRRGAHLVAGVDWGAQSSSRPPRAEEGYVVYPSPISVSLHHPAAVGFGSQSG